MTVTCNICDQEWDRDPALEVKCPTCLSEIGSPCYRPSGHKCTIHAPRDKLAVKLVCDYDPCPAVDTPSAEQRSDDTSEQTTLDF